jgi:PAS domain S-box-containing protein
MLRTRRLRRKDGSTFAAELSIRATADGMAHAIVRDVTERLRREQAVQAERDMLEAILATSVAGILAVEPSGRVFFANRQAEVALGIPHADLIGLEALPRGWELRQADGSPLREEDRATRRVLAGGEPVQDARFVLTWPGGPPRQLSINAAPLRNAVGVITAVVLSVQDRTDREAVQRELREREDQLRNITAAVPGVVYQYVVHRDGTEAFTYVSARAEELLGTTAAEVLRDAQSAWRSMDPEDRRTMQAQFGLAAAGRLPWSFDFRVRRRDGKVRWLRDIATAVEAEGPPRTIWSGVIVDITEQKQMQEQLLQSQKMDSLGRLAGGVAHDFNNLLTIIRGYADVLLAELPEGDARHGEVGEIRYAADRATSLTRQLLAVSRRQVLVPTEVDLNALVGEMERMLLRVIGEHIRIVAVHGEELGPVRADPGQLEQVLLNLSVNARDAMPDGGILTIETRARTVRAGAPEPELRGVPAGEYVELCVSDTGVGMDADTVAKVFEPFFTTKPVGKGTGLGLSTVYGIVQQSNGAITLESTPGKGTRVHVFLPRVASRGEADGAAVDEAAQRPVSERRGTVLVVEDDERVRQLTCRVLEQYGYGVIEARDGTEALALLDAATRRIDAVVSDVLMPGMHGRELVGRLRLRRPDLPVVLLSGYTGDEVSREVRGQPLMAFLQKPFAPQDLVAALEDLRSVAPAKPPATAG